MHDFSVIVLSGAYPSAVAATIDMLASAAKLAPRAGSAVPTYRVYSVTGGAIELSSGFSVQTKRLPRRAVTDRSVWIIPGLGLENPLVLSKRMDDEDVRQVARALKRHADAGGEVAASCSAVFILQLAGLLSKRRATTTWWLGVTLMQRAPDCVVDVDRIVCSDGPVTTAGASFAQTDLMLHLLRARCGSALAQLVSRMLLIDGREAQAPFILPEMMAAGDTLVANVAQYVDAALPAVPTTRELANAFAMSERTLARRITRATGKSTIALVRSVRQRRARTLLETSRFTIDQIAEAVGYQNATSLRRLIQQTTGANPNHYRKGAFGA